MRKRVNQAICALEADGTVKRLSQKWFGGADISAPCAPTKQGG